MKLSHICDSLGSVGQVHLDEFERYYADISASIDNDEYFVTMMENAYRSPQRGRTAAAAEAAAAQASSSGQQTEPPRERQSAQQIMERLKDALKKRGTTGIAQIGKCFRIMDDDGSHTLEPEEVYTALKDVGIVLQREVVMFC